MRASVALLCLLVLASPPRSWAAGGDLDPSFGTGGIVTTPIGSSHAAGQAMAIQPDGRIVVAGYYTLNPDDTDFALVRYEADGTLDTSFGGDGIVTTALSSDFDRAYAIAIDADAKIVVAGDTETVAGALGKFALARYLPDGSLDGSFDSDGIVTTAMPGQAAALSVAIQNDGKLVAAGLSDEHFAVARFNTDGTLDPSFGVGGRVVESFNFAAAFSMALQPDGKIVVAGSARDATFNLDFALVRYDVDGTRDLSFDGDGFVSTAIGPGSEASSVVIQPDGSIVAAGISSNPAGDDFAVVRYKPDGSLDPSFDGDGIVTTAVGGTGAAAHSIVEIQADGKIFVAGGTQGLGAAEFAIVRYEGDGSLDGSFGTGGIAITPIGAQSYIASADIQVDGKIVAAGLAAGTTAANATFAVARYFPGARCAKAAASTNCRTAERSLLLVKGPGDAAKERFIWKWTRGEPTVTAEFGDPTTSTEYVLCLYGGTAGALVAEGEIHVPSSAVHWSRVSAGYKYDDPAASADGMRRTTLRGSDKARAKILFKGQGIALPDLELPFSPATLPLTVRLSGTDACWESRYADSDVVANDAVAFKARAQ